MYGIVTKFLFRNRVKPTNSTNQHSSIKSSGNQGFLMIPGRTKISQSAQIRQALEANFGSKF